MAEPPRDAKNDEPLTELLPVSRRTGFMLKTLTARIPVWVTAIFLGILSVIGVTTFWSVLAGLNISSTPWFPWSFPAMALVLWLFWSYMRGAGPPRSTRKARRDWLRAEPVPANKRPVGYLAAGVFGVTLLQLIVVTTRFIDFTPGQVEQIERASVFPAITVIALMLMASVVAGVVEEIGFRGIMQKPLEIAYGPAVGITLTALVFALIHLPNATIAPHIVPIFFAGSLGWGLLAFLNESIRPNIIVHFLVDAVAFFWVWLNPDSAKALGAESVLSDGIDTAYLVQLVCLGVSVSAFLYLLRKLRDL